MTDTPITAPTYPPPHWSERLKSFIGDLARPFAIYATSTAVAVAVVRLAWTLDPTRSDIFIGAAFLGLGALYGAKALETANVAKHDAQVKVAQAQPGATTQ